MGTTGPPGNVDLQNLFKSPSQLANTSTGQTPYPNSSHPFHNFSAAFPTPESYGSSTSSLPASYPFATHGSKPQPYPPYTQDQVSGASPYQAHGFLQPPPTAPPSSLPISASFHTTSSSRPSSPALDSARLLTLLTQQSVSDAPRLLELSSSSTTQSSNLSSEVAPPPTALAPAVPSAPPVSLAPISASVRVANNKLPRGRHLQGEHMVYDVDVWLPGEAAPQLEVTPISMYTSQPVLLNGRQIAVNRSYICYGLRPNRHIRILNINTASRSLLKGHSERVTDMAFFAEDVHLLASASSDGRVFVRRIVEGPDKDNKMQITDQILLALQFTGDWDSVHPHVSWLSHSQDVLLVGMSRDVFMVDIPKVRESCAPDGFDIEEPVQCPINNAVHGVHCLIKHNGEVMDISTSLWAVSASASKDGTIRVWTDHHASSPSVLIPHEGHQVGAVAFLSAPHCPDHIVLLSGGPLNQELKLWVPTSREGWLATPGPVNWKCIQTLKLTSSRGRPEDEFFNQVLVVPRAHVVLLANAKKSALYVIHVNFGPHPSATRLNYLTEFSVVWPILSFTATSENVMDGDGIVQVYCIQTQAIQQYSLDLSQCLPPAGQPAIFARAEDLAHGPQASSGCATSKAITTEVAKVPCETGSRSRAKSPGPPPALAMSASSTVDMMMDSKVIGVSTPEGKEVSTRDVTVHVSKISAPPPQIGGTPKGSPMAWERIKSPLNEGPSLQVTSPKEKSEYFRSYEQSDHLRERTMGSNAASSQEGVWDPLSLSPRTHFTGTDRPDEDKEWPPHGNLPTSASEPQSHTGSSMHLVTPFELMSMVAKSKLDMDGGSTSSSPPQGTGLSKEHLKQVSSYEDQMGKGDAEAFTIETKEMSESATLNTSNDGAKKVVLLRRGSPIPDSKVDRSSAVYEYTRSDTAIEERLVPQTPFDQDFDSGLAEETHCEDDSDAIEGKDRTHVLPGEEAREQPGEAAVQVVAALSAATRKKKNKNKTDASSSAPPSSFMASAAGTSEQDSSRGPSDVSSLKLNDQIAAMQDSINQLVAMQRDFQKQIQVILAVPVAREVKRVEAILGQRMEKVLKAHMDAMWARLQEDNAKREKVERDQMQQLTSSLSAVLNKELPAAVERFLKKELSSLGPAVARVVTPVIEKSVSASVIEACQKGINEKGVAQLEKSIGAKVEATLLRQLQVQFQTSGKNALQESLRTCLEGSVIPSFEKSCQAMFGQIDAAFQKGLHETQGEEQVATSALTASLQEAVASATSLAATLKGELADGQRRLLALAESGGASRGAYVINGGLPDKAMTVQHVEESLDPTKELGRLVQERKLEEAFTKALSLTDVGVVSWLCNQVDLEALLTTTPPPLSQGVLLALVQQLGCDLGTNTGTKLKWIKDAALALNPHDQSLPRHVMRHFLEKLYNSLHVMLSTNPTPDLVLVIHVVNSLLTACN